MPSPVSSLIPVQFHQEFLKSRYFNFLVLPNWIVNFFLCKNDMKIQNANSKPNQNQNINSHVLKDRFQISLVILSKFKRIN